MWRWISTGGRPCSRSVLRSAGVRNLAVTGDPDASLVSAYSVLTVGTTVVIDAAGKPVYTGVEAATGQITAAVAKATGR
jgi:hypothetical protein